jgi:alkaline phosphatase D
MSRRRLLAGGAGAAGLVVATSLPGRATFLRAQEGTPIASPAASPVATPGASPAASPDAFAATPFGLGVASGDPRSDSVVLWTRLAVSTRDGGGMDPVPYDVRWEVASDETFSQVVQSGTAVAAPTLAHSVHVDVIGLEPATEYFYRFMVGGEESPVGRTKTAPAADAAVDSVRFAFASCAHYEHGYFVAYRHMAEQRFDIVFHQGDYIYEMGPGAYDVYEEDPPRDFTGGSADLYALADFRNRYALYRSDPDLQAAHASAPWATTWDDHEFSNDYAGLVAEDTKGQPDEVFLQRRINAYQAYYEHMPLRPSSMPVGPNLQLYRRLPYGTLAEFQILDTRQYRDDQPCGEGVSVRCPAALDPNTTMTGPDQERWLLEGLDASPATWNVISQQLMMAHLDELPGDGAEFWGDDWNGYPEARNRILGHMLSRGTSNPVVLTGDIHCAWANDLKADWADPSSQTIGTELVCTSISAGGSENPATSFEQYLPDNPHVKFFDPTHGGYTSVELTPERLTAQYLEVADLRDENSPISVIGTFVSEAGNPGIQPA